MFKKKLEFNVTEMVAINFCKILGKYGLKFEMSKPFTNVMDEPSDCRPRYRHFVVYASRRKAYKLYQDLSRYYNRDN